MELQIAARHMVLTSALVDFIHKKIQRVKKHFDDINAVHVVLECEKYRQTAQIVLHVSGNTFRAKETAGDLYSALDLVSDKIDMQLKKFKERRTFHHGKNKFAKAALSLQPSRIRISKKGTTVARTISIEEAAEILDNNPKKIVVFHNPDTQRLQVLMKKSSEYELIDVLFE